MEHHAHHRRARRGSRPARRVSRQRAAAPQPVGAAFDLPHQGPGCGRRHPDHRPGGLLLNVLLRHLYMQNVLRFSATKAGAAYVPVAIGVAISAGVCSRLFVRTGTRPIIVTGALLAAGGIYWLSRIPVHGSYFTDLFPGLMIMSLGLGAVFVGVQTAANADVPPDKAGLAAALINASFQLGAALGLAIFSAIATSRTNHLLARHIAQPDALTSGFHRALLASSVFLCAAAVIALQIGRAHV